MIRAGFGIFDDRYNLSFLFITQPQRPVIIPGETLPGIRTGREHCDLGSNQIDSRSPWVSLPWPLRP